MHNDAGRTTASFHRYNDENMRLKIGVSMLVEAILLPELECKFFRR